MTNPYSLDPATGQSIGTSSDWTYQSTSSTPLTSTSFPVTPTSSDGDPFCTQEFCDYEDIYRSRFFRVYTLGGYFSYEGSSDRDTTDSIRDIDGTVYATHRWQTGPPYCEGPVVTRVSTPNPDVTIEWTKQYKCIDGWLLREPAQLKLDIYRNLWLFYSVSTANGTSTTDILNDSNGSYRIIIHCLRLSKSTGNILSSTSFTVPARGNRVYTSSGIEQVLQDPQGNWYFGSTSAIGSSGWSNASFNEYTGWVVKLRYNLDVVWGVRWTGKSGFNDAISGFNAMVYANNYIYIKGTIRQSPGSAPTLLKVDATTGAFASNFLYAQVSGTFNFGYAPPDGLAVDSSSNIYMTSRPFFWSSANLGAGDGRIHAFKFNSAGVLIWKKAFFIPEVTSGLDWNKVIVTAGDRIFLASRRSRLNGIGIYILEITSAGSVISTRAYFNSSGNHIPSQIATYLYAPQGLFFKTSNGDHVDTTQEVEVFNVGTRAMRQLSNTTTADMVEGNQTALNPTFDSWDSVVFDFAPYYEPLTVTAPDRSTVLDNIGQVRD